MAERKKNVLTSWWFGLGGAMVLIMLFALELYIVRSSQSCQAVIYYLQNSGLIR